MKKSALFIPFILMTTACGSFTPTEGTWTMSPIETVEDTCNFSFEEEVEATESNFKLTLSEEGFSILGDTEGSQVVSCILDEDSDEGDEGQKFTCTNLSFSLADEETFSITATTSYDGFFASSTELTLNNKSDIVCEGEDCPTVEQQVGVSFPCSISATATATFSE